MRLSTLMLRKSGHSPVVAPLGHVATLQSPPCLQPLKISWPRLAVRPSFEPTKSLISCRSFGARVMRLLKVCGAPPFVPEEKRTDTETVSLVRLEMKMSEMNSEPPPAT